MIANLCEILCHSLEKYNKIFINLSPATLTNVVTLK